MIKRFFLIVAFSSIPMTAKAVMDYTHWAEGVIIMIAQDLFSSKANTINIGESSRDGIPQFAIKYGLDPDEQDDAGKNAVLFECGMHAREWYAAESCYWLMDYLYRHYKDEQVQELFSEVDVWIIPQSNPAGRDLDDPALGDPTEFTYVCEGGEDAGDTCDGDDDCDGDCYKSGWRTNANKTSCDVGVDLARNFSSGWNDAAAICDTTYSSTTNFMKFRGDDPFSEVETLNLRRFIHNHMISMVLIQHAQSEEIDHRWRSSLSASDHMVDELVSASATASASWSPDPSLAKSSVGGGSGQFSAWLTSDSDVSGELDDGTKRNIPTFFFELPISPGGNYYGTGYQDTASDGSNTFHPSGDVMETLWEETILELLTYVTRQARSPSCPVDSSGTRIISECESNDFGLVGAKIAVSAGTPGLLDYDPSTREETLPWGIGRRVVFSVQNFSSSGSSTSTQATVTIERGGSTVATHVLPVSLAMGDRGVFSVSHSFTAGGDYRVSIALDSDDFSRNNEKVFAFQVDSLRLISLLDLFGTGALGFIAPATKKDDWRLDFSGMFPKVRLKPHLTGLELSIRTYLPWVSGPQPEVKEVKLVLPAGKNWWQPQIRGGWTYVDQENVNGPVQMLTIQKSSKKGRDRPELQVEMSVTGNMVESLQQGRAWRVSFIQPRTKTRLNAFVAATGYKLDRLQDREMPTDEIEDEPHN
jgi:hypothetical protein